jgi:hypothetical protein
LLRAPVPYRSGILGRVRPILVGRAVDLATANHLTTTAKSKPTPRLASTAYASLDRQAPTRAGDEPAVGTAGDHGDPGHAAACPTATLHHLPVGHNGRGNARTPDAHAGHRTPDTGRSDARTGHWTPVAWTGTRGHCPLALDTGRWPRTPTR